MIDVFLCSNWVMMNRETRRLSKIPDEVRQEVLPFYLDRSIIAAAAAGGRKIEKLTDSTAEHIRSGLAVRRSRPEHLSSRLVGPLSTEKLVPPFSPGGVTWTSTST